MQNTSVLPGMCWMLNMGLSSSAPLAFLPPPPPPPPVAVTNYQIHWTTFSACCRTLFSILHCGLYILSRHAPSLFFTKPLSLVIFIPETLFFAGTLQALSSSSLTSSHPSWQVDLFHGSSPLGIQSAGDGCLIQHPLPSLGSMFPTTCFIPSSECSSNFNI